MAGIKLARHFSNFPPSAYDASCEHERCNGSILSPRD
jgi:hypothetical protein